MKKRELKILLGIIVTVIVTICGYAFVNRPVNFCDSKVTLSDGVFKSNIGEAFTKQSNFIHESQESYLLLVATEEQAYTCILSKTDSGWVEQFNQTLTMKLFIPRDIIVNFDDFNFDGNNEVLLPINIGYGGVNVGYRVISLQKDGFKEVKDFDSISNPRTDKSNKTIRSSMRSGMNWDESTYTWDGSTVSKLD